jgi:Ni/Fe-hydrogenase 1 B-type cytochrome subunit
MKTFMRSRKQKLREVYVWELPVRLFHWLNALCIVILCVTGYLIANPPAILTATEANFSYWFGVIRFIHFVVAYVFLFNFAFRIYWAFAGNRYANWRNYVPLKKAQWQEIYNVFMVDIFMIKKKPIEKIGHNAMAYVTYLMLFFAFLLQCLTGFGLYAKMSNSFFADLFNWVVPLFGGDLMTRQVHHFLMWFFILVAFVHVYLVLYHDYIERHGITSSMIGGWKFIDEHMAVDEEISETVEQLTKSVHEKEPS